VDRAGKEELVSHYNGIFENAGVIVVTHYSGLSVPDLDELRHQMADVGGTVKVTKNRLVKLALAGTPNESVSEFFSGPTAIAFSEDPVAAPKVAAKFAKENDNLKIVGGIMDGVVAVSGRAARSTCWTYQCTGDENRRRAASPGRSTGSRNGRQSCRGRCRVSGRSPNNRLEKENG
jgi:ribosomal protein L10